LQLTADELLADVAVGVGALLTSVQAARPFMSDGARITVTGSMAADEPSAGAASLGVQKAGVRNLVHSIDARLAADGIRAVSVTVRGALGAEGAFTPDRVAAAIVAAARQDASAWRAEVPYSG
jgi:NAD(P)-dependent dehydrogenase (short-subunit alcohol dehydrogenase family)